MSCLLLNVDKPVSDCPVPLAYETIEAIAIHDYEARSSEEISFRKGQSVYVVQQTDDGNWWDGFLGSKRGYIPTQYVEIVPYDGPKSPLRGLADKKDDLNDPEIRPADEQQTELDDSELPDPPVTVTVSDSDSHALPDVPEQAGPIEEVLDNSEPLPPPPDVVPSPTDPLPPPPPVAAVDKDSIDDAVEALSTALIDLENFVLLDNEQQRPEQDANTEQHKQGEEKEGELTRENKSSSEESGKEEQKEEPRPLSVEREPTPVQDQIEEQENKADEEQQPEHEQQAVQHEPPTPQQQEKQPSTPTHVEFPHNRQMSPARPKVLAKPPQVALKPSKPVARVSSGGYVHSAASPKPSKLVLHSKSGDNIFGQIEGVLSAAVARAPDRGDSRKDVTSPSSVSHSPLLGKKFKKQKPPTPVMAPKPTTAGKPKPGIQGQAVAALASQIKAKANVFRSRPTYGRREDETDSAVEGNSAASTPEGTRDVDEPGITHL